MTPPVRRYPIMDSLRAVGVLFVIMTHVSVTSGVVEGSWLRPYMTNVTWVIAVFFLLSAFLLYRPYVRARLNGGPRPDTLAYGWGRFLRVVPAYWVALTICTVWLGREGEVFTLGGIPIYYGFGQIYFDQHALGGLSVAWSICVEAVFYAFLPIWAWLMLRVPGATRSARFRTELVGIAGLILIGLGYRVLMVTTDIHTYSGAVLALPAFLDWFAAGMAFAALSVWLEGRDRLPAPLRLVDRRPGLCWLTAIFLYWLVSNHVGPLYGYPGPESGAQVVEHILLLLIAIALFLPTAFGDFERGWTRKMLAHPVVLYVGMTSYAIYLWHLPVFEQLKRWNFSEVDFIDPFVAWVAATLAISVVIATVSWYCLEKPMLSLKRAWRRGPAPQPGEAAAEPAAKTSTQPALTR